MYNYSAFGLRVDSELEISEFQKRSATQLPHVCISFEAFDNACFHHFSVLFEEVTYAIDGKNCCIRIKDVGEVLVSEGKTIKINLLAHADLNVLRIYLLGTAFGVLLMQRNTFCLHASGLIFNNKTFLFIGDSGMGKSTTCRYMLGKNRLFIGDDYIPLLYQNNTLMSIPAFPQIKLWDKTLPLFEMTPKNCFKKIRKDIPKYSFLNTTSFHNQPTELAGVMLLDWNATQDFEISSIENAEKMLHFQRNIYRKEMISDKDNLAQSFQLTAHLTKNIPLFRVTGQRSLEGLSKINDFIEAI